MSGMTFLRNHFVLFRQERKYVSEYKVFRNFRNLIFRNDKKIAILKIAWL